MFLNSTSESLYLRADGCYMQVGPAAAGAPPPRVPPRTRGTWGVTVAVRRAAQDAPSRSYLGRADSEMPRQ